MFTRVYGYFKFYGVVACFVKKSCQLMGFFVYGLKKHATIYLYYLLIKGIGGIGMVSFVNDLGKLWNLLF